MQARAGRCLVRLLHVTAAPSDGPSCHDGHLQFLSPWLARDPARLGDSLAQFVGHAAYGLAQLRGDLERFVFLLAAATASPSLTLARPSQAPHHDQAAGAPEHRRWRLRRR
jgi:hypothetical protein